MIGQGLSPARPCRPGAASSGELCEPLAGCSGWASLCGSSGWTPWFAGLVANGIKLQTLVNACGHDHALQNCGRGIPGISAPERRQGANRKVTRPIATSLAAYSICMSENTCRR